MNYRKKAILMVVGLFCLNLAILAQAVSLKMNNVSVKEAMTQLKNKSGYSFVYKVGDLDTRKMVSVEAKQLNEAIDQILYGQNVVYEIKGKNIIVQREQVRSNSSKEGKKRRVTGVVNDANGDPIIGATIKEKGTANGTASDLDAKFSLEVSPGALLEVSYIGFQTQEVKVGDRIALSVTLNENQQILDEVVVVGYGTTSRKNLTTSIATVKTEKISKAATSNISGMLLGRAAGLQATVSSPQPGGGINISIRGGATPIYVVDGVVMPSGSFEVGTGSTSLPSSVNRAGLAGLNPNDIESIEVLKDASAAIYGIGAADGVILVTTKRGKTGKPTIVYDGSYSIQKHYSYLDVLNGPEQMNMVNVYSKEKYLYGKGQYPYGNIAYDGKWEPIFSPTQIANAITTNWVDQVLKTGAVTNHNLTINGGSEKFQYYLGVNYYKEDATVHNSDMERYTLRTNITSQLTDFLKLTAIINLNQNNYTNSTIGGDTGNLIDQGAGALFAAIFYPSYLPIYNEEGAYTIFSRTPNPVSMQEISDKSEQNGYYMNFSADVDIIKNMLSAKLLYGLNKENNSRDSYIPSDIYYALQYKSRGNLGYGKRQQSTLEGTLTFQHKFGNFLDMNLMAGMGRYLDSGDGSDLSYENANDHIQGSKVETADGPFYPTSYKYKNEKRSQFVRGSFDLFERYIVSASLRRDGTDKFFPSKKYALFPSVSIAWKMTEEPFMKNASWINMLKLRASYGETGSDNLGTTLYGVVTTTREDVQFNNNTVTYIPYILSGANYEDVTWQKTVMKNIGLDFSIFKDRIWGSVDVFRNDVTHLLGTAPTELLGMHGQRPINGGHYKRTGVDVALNSLNMQTNDFKWTSQLTMSHYNAAWIERMPNYDYQKYQKRKNEPMNAYYYYKMDGLINMDKSNMPESQRSLGAAACMPGYPIIVDKNEDGIIDVNDAYMDNTLPKLYFGFGNTFTWKNFDLDIFMYGQLGVKKTNTAYSYSSSAGNLSNGVNTHNYGVYAYYIWNSQTNSNGRFPGIAFDMGASLPGNLRADYLREDASYLRVRNITLGYNLGPKELGIFKGYVRGIRLFLDFQNPFTFTKYKGYDPEIVTSSSNLTGGQYPQMRVYSLGAKLTF